MTTSVNRTTCTLYFRCFHVILSSLGIYCEKTPRHLEYFTVSLLSNIASNCQWPLKIMDHSHQPRGSTIHYSLPKIVWIRYVRYPRPIFRLANPCFKSHSQSYSLQVDCAAVYCNARYRVGQSREIYSNSVPLSPPHWPYPKRIRPPSWPRVAVASSIQNTKLFTWRT